LIKGDYDQLRLFTDSNWLKEFEPFGDNVNDVWIYFKSELESGMKLYIPMSKRNSWKQKSAWSRPITAFQKEMINKKQTLAKISKDKGY